MLSFSLNFNEYSIFTLFPQALMLFLQKVSANSSKSLMDSNNLALVMVPNLMSLPDQGGCKRPPAPPKMDKLTGLVSYCSLIFSCVCLTDPIPLCSHCYFVSMCKIVLVLLAHLTMNGARTLKYGQQVISFPDKSAFKLFLHCSFVLYDKVYFRIIFLLAGKGSH